MNRNETKSTARRPPAIDAATTGLDEREVELIWRAALEWGDPNALKWLARSLEPVEDEELGGGD